MKTILVATDFSEAAHNACVYGTALAKEFKARLILFTSYDRVPLPVTETPVLVTPEDVRKRIRELLEKEAKDVDPKEEINIEISCKEGLTTNSILKTVKEKNVDLIITGMKKTGKGIRRVLGSTVTSLARKTTVPLIIVPEEAGYKKIDSIALANERDITADADKHLLDALFEITRKFQSKLYVVRITRNRLEASPENAERPVLLERLPGTNEITWQSIEGKSVPRTLNAFIEKGHIGMLAMMPHKYSLPERWFVKSTAQSIVFEIRVPLLILPVPAS